MPDSVLTYMDLGILVWILKMQQMFNQGLNVDREIREVMIFFSCSLHVWLTLPRIYNPWLILYPNEKCLTALLIPFLLPDSDGQHLVQES